MGTLYELSMGFSGVIGVRVVDVGLSISDKK